MDGASTGTTYGQEYHAANQGIGQPTETGLSGPGGSATGPVQQPEKRSLTDKVKGLLGGNKHHENDGTTTNPATDPAAGTGTGVYGDHAVDDTDGTGSKVGCFDKIKGKVGKGHTATGPADHSPAEPGAYGTNAATGPGAARSQSSPYGSTGVGPTSGTGATTTDPDYNRTSGASYNTQPGQRSESSPYGATGVGPTSGTVPPESGPAPGAAGGYGQAERAGVPPGSGPVAGSLSGYGQAGQNVRTGESPYDSASANPENWNPQANTGTGYTGTGTGYGAGYGGDGNQQNSTGPLPGGWPQPTTPGGAMSHAQAGPGATAFTDPQGNLHNDNPNKKEGFVSKIMDKLHSPKSKTQPTGNAPY